jgi:uroporphyrinogen-III synthase
MMTMDKKSREVEVARSKTAREMFEEKDQRWRAETQAIREYENRPDDETSWW